MSRTKGLLAGVGAGLVARAIAMIGPLIVTPISLAYLGDQVFGLWAAMTAMIASALFADLGLGSGLMTRLTVALANDEPHAQVSALIGSAYASLTVLSAALTAVATWAITATNWSLIFEGANAVQSETAGRIILITVVAFIVNIPLSLVHRVQFATQRSATSNIWQAIGSISTVLAAIMAIRLDLPAWAVVLAASSAVPITNVINSTWFFGFIRRDLTPRARAANRTIVADLLRLGLGFSVIAALTGMAISLDPFLVATTLGLEDTATFSVASRFLAPLTAVAASVALPLWAALGASITQGDVAWTRRTVLRVSIASFAATTVLGCCISWFSPPLLEWWLGPSASAVPDVGLLISLTAFISVVAAVVPFLSLESSRSRLRNQIVGLGAFAFMGIPLKLVALQQFSLTTLGWVGAIVYASCMIPVCLLSLRALSVGDERIRLSQPQW